MEDSDLRRAIFAILDLLAAQEKLRCAEGVEIAFARADIHKTLRYIARLLERARRLEEEDDG